MKKNIYLFAVAAVALAMSSCSEEDFVQQNGSGQLRMMEITASMPNGDSRTSFTDGGIKWQANDALSVFVGGGQMAQFNLVSGEGANEATFGGTASVGSAANNVAYYPYAGNVSLTTTTEGYQVSATFPTKQTWAADGSFGPNSLPMVAVTETTAITEKFQFKPLGGWLQLYVKGDTKITKVVMKAKDKKIAGNYTVTISYGVAPTMTMAEDAVSYVALDCGEGVQLKSDEATLFTFAVAPFDFQAGEVSFDLFDNEGMYMPNAYVVPKAGTVIANAYYTISVGAPINYVGIEPPLKVGNVAFTTMEEALDAALQMDEAEIVFGANVELAQPMTISEGKEITLKLGDYSLSVAEDATEAPIVNNGTLSLVGGTIDNYSAKVITNNGTMTIDGTTINAKKVSGIESSENSTLTIEDANITAYESVVRALGATITIKDGVYKQTGTAVGGTTETYRYCVDARWNNEVKAIVTIEGGEFETNNGLFNVGSDVTINGGKFTSKIEQVMTRHMFYAYAPLTINDGEFYGVANSAAGGCFICMASSSADVTIKGGKFTSLWSTGTANNIIEYYAAGGKHEITGGLFNTNKGITNFVKENTDEATKTAYPYVGIPCSAIVNGQKFETLEAALDAVATTGGTVDVVAGEYTFPAAKLTAGVTLNCAEGTVFEGSSSLNIKGATVIGATFKNDEGGIINQSKVDGIFENCRFEGKNALRSGYAGEKVVFKNCYFKENGSEWVFHFDAAATGVTDAEIICEDCTFDGKRVAIGGSIKNLTMTNCKFLNGNYMNVYCNSILTNCDFGSTEVRPLGGSITYTSCTINGSALTVDKVKFFNGYPCRAIIDGKSFAFVSDTDELKNAISKYDDVEIILSHKYEYTGCFDIKNKSNITLRPYPGHNPKITGLVYVTDSKVKLQGLTLSNPDGVKTESLTAVGDLIDQHVNGNKPVVGVYVNSTLDLVNCIFNLTSNITYGYYAYASTDVKFDGCTFNCNKVRPIGNNGNSLTVTGCTFNDQYHYSARIFENSEEKQTIVFTGNTIQGSNDKGEFEGINISKKGNSATVLGDFTIKGNTASLKYRHHKNVTMSTDCKYDTDITNFAFEKEE